MTRALVIVAVFALAACDSDPPSPIARAPDAAAFFSVEFDAPRDGAWIRDDLRIDLRVTGPVAHVEVAVEGEVFARIDEPPWRATGSIADADEGPQILVAKAFDTNGEVARAQIEVRIDRTPPALAVRRTPDPIHDAFTLDIDLEDEGVVVEITASIDRGPSDTRDRAGEVTFDLAHLAAGSWTARVEARDAAGNVGVWTDEIAVDRPPIVGFEQPAAGARITGPSDVVVSARDDLSAPTIAIEVDGLPLEHRFGTARWTPAFRAGPRVLRAVAQDDRGQQAAVELRVEVDHRPQLELLLCDGDCAPLEADALLGGRRSVELALRDDAAPVDVRLEVDGAVVASVAVPPYRFTWHTADVPDGPHRIAGVVVSPTGERFAVERTVRVANVDPPCDGDGDGAAAVHCAGADCDDADPRRFPGAVDRCDGIDDDCSGDEAVCLPCRDRFEPNETFDGAPRLTPGEHVDLGLCGGGPAMDREDLYAVELLAGQRLVAELIYDPEAGLLDLDLRDPDGQAIALGDADGRAEIDVGIDGLYVVRVAPFRDAVNDYALRVLIADAEGCGFGAIAVDDQCVPCRDAREPDDTRAQATPWNGEPLLASTLCGDRDVVDWVTFEATAGETWTAEARLDTVDGLFRLDFRDAEDGRVGSAQRRDDVVTTRWTAPHNGVHAVTATLGEGGARYDLALSKVPSPVCGQGRPPPDCFDCADPLEPNDTDETAVRLGSTRLLGLSVCAGLDPSDWYAFDLAVGAVLDVSVGLIDETGSVWIAASGPDGRNIAFGRRDGGSQLLSIRVEHEGRHTIHVRADPGVFARYVLDAHITPAADCVDGAEPNDAPADAAPWPAPGGAPLALCEGDADWFELDPPVGGSAIAVRADFDPAFGQVGLALHGPDGTTLERVPPGNRSPARVAVRGHDGPLTIEAIWGGGGPLSYTLVAQTAPCEGPPVRGPFALESGVAAASDADACAAHLFEVEAPAGAYVLARTDYAGTDGRLALALTAGELVARDPNGAAIAIHSPDAATCTLRLDAAQLDPLPYLVTARVTDAPCGVGVPVTPVALGPAPFEIAVDVETGGQGRRDAVCRDTAAAPETALALRLGDAAVVTAEVTAAEFDAVLYLRAHCDRPSTERACDDDAGGDRRPRVTAAVEPGVWFLVVDGFGGGAGRARVRISVAPPR